MKKIIYLGILFMFILGSSIAQTPESFNYQAAIRNSSGVLITEKSVSVKVSILQGSDIGISVYSETHSVTTSDIGLISLKIGEGENASSGFSSIDWSASTYYLKIELDENGASSYTPVGVSQLLSVPYALYSNVASKLGDDKVYTTASDTLFVVKDHDGNVVFAVFPDGAKVYVNKTAKGKVGGFAVSGRTPGKAVEEDFFIITADSTRIYIPDESVKGSVGGFAVSGRTPSKGIGKEYFNISGRGSTALGIINPSSPRMLWYPKREAFLVGRVLIEHPDSVGLNSIATGFESKAIGDYSQAFGYQSIARKNYSTAIGKNAIANGLNSFAFGNAAIAVTDDAYAIGSGAIAIGAKSFAFGSVGVDTLGDFTDNPIALGDYSFAMGLGTRSVGTASMSIGANSIASGDFSTTLGFRSTSSGDRSVALGPLATSSGYGSVAVGYRSRSEGSFSFAGGLSSKTTNYGAVALGVNCEATGSRSVALGDGNTASGAASFAAGKDSEAAGHQSVALGMYVNADGWNSYVMGRYAGAGTKTGTFVYNSVSDKTGLYPSQAYEMNFKSENGFRFFAAIDTAESSAVIIKNGGSVGIGIKNPVSKLHVNGSIRVVGGVFIADGDTLIVPDYVFNAEYNLETIEDHAEFMWREKHLPSLKSAIELKAGNGYNMSERREQMLEELEKAHIYIEQLHERIKILEEQNTSLKKNEELENRIKNLEKILNQNHGKE